MIAMAMSCDPEVLIADEPTTALDVTIQAQILDLMKSLNQSKGTAILLITHDLGVVADICNRVIVMYAGQIVEEGTVRMILKDPKHPYTQGLIRSLPKLTEREQELYSIPGTVPQPGSIEVGCRFAERCEYAFDACFTENPPLFELEESRACRCLLYREEEEVSAEPILEVKGLKRILILTEAFYLKKLEKSKQWMGSPSRCKKEKYWALLVSLAVENQRQENQFFV